MKQPRKQPGKRTAKPPAPEVCAEPPHCPIVAMGASAGGLEVFQQFFDRMPADTGMAFILVQHLDPHHPTLMPELLAKHTRMKVVRAANGLKVQANHIYVIAPNTALTMDGCRLQAQPLKPNSDRKLIDLFFRSIAQDQHQNVVGIVLTGTGSDGSAGLKAVKEQGGLTMAQTPSNAKFDSMPQSAIATGAVDYVLPVEEMPARVVEYIEHLNVLHRRKGAQTIQEEAIKFLPKIFPILRKTTGHDFSRYKQSTLVRRIQRRMQVAYLDSVAAYVEHLHDNPEEVQALFKDLLIGVTQFFRDTQSFAVLAKKVIPQLFRGKKSEDQVRVWIPGCASGEEAYSFAILLAEYAATLKKVPKIQVFATDLDTEALEFARRAKYPEEIALQISPERLQRFFVRAGADYQVIDEIREMCIFSPHNLIKDPPFSRVDLISCRNLLIYLETDLQKKLLPLFHFALNPNGFLFLGPSENVASRSELFRALDPKHRIFQRKPTLLHSPAHVPFIDPAHVTKLQSVTPPQFTVTKETNLARSIERVILEEYSPASVVINKQGDVVYFSGDTGKYLQPPAGVPNNKLVAMARKNLRLELRSVIHRATTTGKEASRAVAIKTGRKVQPLNLIVRPLVELGDETDFFIVLFLELHSMGKEKAVEVADTFSHPEHPVIKQLEGELRTTKEDLQTTIEELETSNEELKSANEELLSMNEELQSGNEELQTSKEEVQSANDELHRKIDELDVAMTELKRSHEERVRYSAIVESSDDAIVGKKLDGTITSWNRAAERIFGYSAEEMVGQPIFKIIPPDLHGEERKILERLTRGERIDHYETIRLSKSGKPLQISLTTSPIRDQQGNIIGASKIARNVTPLREVELAARENEQRFRAIFNQAAVGIALANLDGQFEELNARFCEILGYSQSELRAMTFRDLTLPDDLQQTESLLRRLLKREINDYSLEKRYRRKDGAIVWSLTNVALLTDKNDVPQRLVGVIEDITRRKQIEEQLLETRRRLEATLNAAEIGTWTWNLKTNRLTADKNLARIFPMTDAEAADSPPETYLRLIHPADKAKVERAITEAMANDSGMYEVDYRVQQPDGSVRWVVARGKVERDGEGQPSQMPGVVVDITEQKEAEESVHDTAQRLTFALSAGHLGDWSWRASDDRVVLSQRASEIFGLAPDISLTWTQLREILHEHDRERARLAVETALVNRTDYDVEYLVHHSSGEVRWVAAKGRGVYNQYGVVTGMTGIVQDITEQKRADEIVRRSENDLRALANSIPQLAWMAEPNGHIFWYNQRWFDYTGTTLEQMSGWGWQSVHHPDVLPKVIERWTASIETGQPFEMEFPLRGADGNFRTFLTRVNPVKNAEGQIVRWFGTNTDVEQVRLAREALQEETRILELLNTTGKSIASELNVQTLVQNVTDAGTQLSGAKFGAFFYNVINEQGESFLLYTLSGAPREAFEKFGLPRNTPVFNPTFRGEGVVRSNDITKDPRYGQMSPHHGMPKGHLPVRSYLAVPVISRSGEVIGGLFFGHPEPNVFTERSERIIVGVAAQAAIAIDNARLYETAQRQIAERRRAEAELQNAKAGLEERVRERTATLQETTEQLETFCYTMAHDLRSPLRAQQSYAQVLLDDYKGVLDEDGRHYAQRIINSARRLDKLVNDLLAYSRLSRDELKFGKVELDKVLHDIRSSLADELTRRQAEVSVSELPAVSAHEATLNLIITNLVSNALKFVESGVNPRINIWSELKGDDVRLWVEDNGIGMDNDGREKIFGVFQRLHPTDKYPGTGIGLAIVQKGVTRMGGHVGVESEPGKGSRFWIELPKA